MQAALSEKTKTVLELVQALLWRFFTCAGRKGGTLQEGPEHDAVAVQSCAACRPCSQYMVKNSDRRTDRQEDQQAIADARGFTKRFH